MSRQESLEEIFIRAGVHGKSRARISQESNYALNDPRSWGELNLDDVNDINLQASQLREVDGKPILNNILDKFNHEICREIQFPIATGYMHGLGVIASAMTKSFYFKYGRSEKPVNLYVVTAQPPSSGKSAINSAYCDPISTAYDEINKKNLIERAAINFELGKVKAELAQASSADAVRQLEKEKNELECDLNEVPIYKAFVTDGTNEGLQKLIEKQGGMFNIISAEADAIDVILGNVYGEGKGNHGMFLSGWDAERISVVRAGRDDVATIVKSSMAVIAQDASIDSILEAGMSGRGISERVLMLREKSNLGERDHSNKFKAKDSIIKDYQYLIENIVNQTEDVIIEFNDECIELITNYRQGIEKEFKPGGKLSNALLTGFMGKADKHILKIASVIHAIENWCKGGKKNPIVKDSTVLQAIAIFDGLSKTYIDACDKRGFTGSEAERKCVLSKLRTHREKNKLFVSFETLYNQVRSIKPFLNSQQISTKLKTTVIPELEKLNCCVYDEKTKRIYINPMM